MCKIKYMNTYNLYEIHPDKKTNKNIYLGFLREEILINLRHETKDVILEKLGVIKRKKRNFHDFVITDLRGYIITRKNIKEKWSYLDFKE